MWETEEIPSADHIFMRVHACFLKYGDPVGAFRDQGLGMSTDWEKYSTPQQARNRAKKPNENAIVKLNVGKIRELLGLLVEHRPIQDNRAHSEVVGEKTPEIRIKLNRLAEMVIGLET